MEIDERLKGTFLNTGKDEMLAVGGFLQLLMVTEGNAAYCTKGDIGLLVRDDVAADEVLEIADDQFADGWNMQMTMDKRGEGGQEAVGHGLTIDPVDDLCERQVVFRFELLAQFVR